MSKKFPFHSHTQLIEPWWLKQSADLVFYIQKCLSEDASQSSDM